jgi:hypothetical protein
MGRTRAGISDRRRQHVGAVFGFSCCSFIRWLLSVALGGHCCSLWSVWRQPLGKFMLFEPMTWSCVRWFVWAFWVMKVYKITKYIAMLVGNTTTILRVPDGLDGVLCLELSWYHGGIKWYILCFPLYHASIVRYQQKIQDEPPSLAYYWRFAMEDTPLLLTDATTCWLWPAFHPLVPS